MVYAAETARLWLEPLGPKHLDDFHEIWSDKETLVWSTRTPTKTTSESLAWLHQSIPPLHPYADKYAILLRPSPSPSPSAPSPNSTPSSSASTAAETKPKMIGTIGVKGEGEGEICYELAYTLNKRFWGKGYGTEALGAFVGRDGGLYWRLAHRKSVPMIVAKTDTENMVSQRMVQRIGARKGQLMYRAYALGRDKGQDGKVPMEKMRDSICWYIDRPTESRA